jgi:hypothetical protein
MSINTCMQDGKLKEVSSKMLLDHMHAVVHLIAWWRHLGLEFLQYGNTLHPLRCHCGNASSQCPCLHYHASWMVVKQCFPMIHPKIKQVQEFNVGISNRMITMPDFFTCPDTGCQLWWPTSPGQHSQLLWMLQCLLWHPSMGTTPFLCLSPLKSPKLLVMPLMLASYLGSHSQVLESGQGLGWFYVALNPKIQLASTLLLEAIATRRSGMVLKYLRCGSTRTRAIAETNDRSRRPHT